MDSDQHLAFFGMRLRRLLVGEGLGATSGVQTDRLHAHSQPLLAELELDCNLQSISASIEGSLPENTATWQVRYSDRKDRISIASPFGYAVKAIRPIKTCCRSHRRDGKRFVVRADEKLTAFLDLESAIRGRQRLEALS
jgi:hypothetical protein